VVAACPYSWFAVARMHHGRPARGADVSAHPLLRPERMAGIQRIVP